MTLDMIGGASIIPHKFIEGLEKWRSDLRNKNAPKLDTFENISINLGGNDDYAKLSLAKNQDSIQLVHDEPIPISDTQYLEVKFSVTLLTGVSPSLRVIATPSTQTKSAISGFAQNGPSQELLSGVTTEISAIIGPGARPGVDLVWTNNSKFLMFGIEIFGANGANLLIDNISITDVSGAFMAVHSGIVDIRDFGGIGDGATDCFDAFATADSLANGRTIYIPEGDFYISKKITIHALLQCKGRIIADKTTPIMLAGRFDLESYIHAFKDDVVAFEKAFQALFMFSDHTTLDMRGRIVTLTKPIRLCELLPDSSKFTKNRVLLNGSLDCSNSPDWNASSVQGKASYDESTASKLLTDVENIEQVEIGSHVHGTGVGREIYVIDKDVIAKTVTLTHELYGANSRQTYTFTRFRFLLDLSEVDWIANFHLMNMEFSCRKTASAIMLSKDGIANKIVHCIIGAPGDRGICSYGFGCNGITIESCQLGSWEWSVPANERRTIGICTHSGDMKIRNNRGVYFRHFMVIARGGHIIMGNHFFAENPDASLERNAGIVFSSGGTKTTFTGNYVDHCWIELGFEHNGGALERGNKNFEGIQILGNIFTGKTVASGSPNHFIVLAPLGENCKIMSMNVCNNMFINYGHLLTKVEGVNESIGTIDWSKTTQLCFENNTFSGFEEETWSPIVRKVSKTSATKTWEFDFQNQLPFNSFARSITSIVGNSDLNPINMPVAEVERGTNKTKVALLFDTATKGSATITVSANSL